MIFLERIRRHDTLLSRLSLLGVLSSLLLATFATTYTASSYVSSSSDDLVYPYLFQHIKLHNILLPGQHTNILKFPLYLLQAHLPYTFRSFMIVTVGLTVITIILWVILAARIMSRSSLTVISTYMLCVVLSSGLFILETTGTTIRNIEYPITLLFIIICSRLLSLREFTKKDVLLLLTATGFYILTGAGDSFFLYTATPAILITLCLLSRKFPDRVKLYRTLKLPVILVFGSAVFSFLLTHLLGKAGIIQPFTNPAFEPHILAINHIAPSITTACTQLLDMMGANIFGLSVAPHNGLTFVCFAFFIAGTIGFVRILCEAVRIQKTNSVGDQRSFIFTASAVTYFTVFVVYILSDLAVTQGANGAIVSAGQDRYLSFMPLLLGFGVVYSLKSVTRDNLKSATLFILTVCVIAASFTNIHHDHRYGSDFKNSEIAVAKAAKSKNVRLIISGYWYGASVKFWSQNKLDYATVAACNAPQPTFNNRRLWYISTGVTPSALVVMRDGPDAPYWIQCSDSQLINIYGKPAEIVHLNAAFAPSLWIYNYDLRTRIGPMAL